MDGWKVKRCVLSRQRSLQFSLVRSRRNRVTMSDMRSQAVFNITNLTSHSSSQTAAVPPSPSSSPPSPSS